MLTCTRCSSSGFLNIEQVDEAVLLQFDSSGDHQHVVDWIAKNKDHDVNVCDCCGDGAEWYGEPGSHDRSDFGKKGPYAYNGGLPKCH